MSDQGGNGSGQGRKGCCKRDLRGQVSGKVGCGQARLCQKASQDT